MLSKEQLKERLVNAEIPTDVVDALLADLGDEDLARMKEDLTAEDLVAALKDAAKEDDAPEETVETETPDDTTDDADALAEVFKSLEDQIVNRISAQLETLQVEVQAPQLAEVIETVQALKEYVEAQATALKEMQDAWNEILKGDTQRLKEMFENLSPAQRIRLKSTLVTDVATQRVAQFKDDKEKESNGLAQKETKTDIFHAQISPGERPVVRDAQGRTYADLGAFAMGQPEE